MNKSMMNVVLAVAFGACTLSAQAATLNTGDMLSINTGVGTGYHEVPMYDDAGNIIGSNWVYNNVTVSWFAMDTDGNSTMAGSEKTPLAQGTTGIVIGTATTAGASHGGAIAAGDTNAITAPWNFFGQTGSDYATVGITGSTGGVNGVGGLNFSGWTVTWNGIPTIPMGTGAWGTVAQGYVNGVAQFTWDGVYGNAYSLNYRATVPAGDASGFGGVKYQVHFEGIVTAAPVSQVPVPAAAWLLGSGLIGLVGVARRKTQA